MPISKIRIYISTACLLAILSKSSSQSLPDLKFTHINTANGLSSPHVRNVMQDSKGLIWVCTTDGLNRYDGNSFKVYKQVHNNPNSLPGDDIWNITEDIKGNYWVGTQTGLCYFEPQINRYTNYTHQPGNPNSLAYFRAENLVVDEENNLWVGSLNGLQKFNTKTKQFQLIQFATKEELIKNVNNGAVYYLYLDNKKQLWVQAGGRLFLVNKKTLAVELKIERWQFSLGVNSIYQDKNGQYWLAYWAKGLAKYDGVHPPSPEDFVDTKGVYFRLSEWKDLNNDEWLVATHELGIYFYSEEKKELLFYYNDVTKPNSFAAHTGGEIITDNKNNIWIATSSGLELVEPEKQFFNYHYLGEKKDREDYYYYGTPFPVLRDDNYYWVGLWSGRGLLKLDSNWRQVKHFTSIPENSENQFAKAIFDIIPDAPGKYWISTDEALVNYDVANNRYKKFLPLDIKPDAFEFRKILNLNDKLFIRTRHNGLYVFDKTSGIFEKHFTTGNSLLPHNDVNDIVADRKGNIWLATTAGICKLDTSGMNITSVYSSVTGNKLTAQASVCRAIDTDALGNLWIGCENGISKYSLADKTFINYTNADGLCSNYIINLITDKNNNIWVNTQNGVSVFKQKEKQFQNFYKEDGLPQNSLDGKLFKDAKGTIYLTHTGIVITANPDNIPFNKNQPAILITDVLVNNREFKIQKKANNEKQVVTQYRNNSFEIAFAVLNYNSPKRNKYYYKLERIDKDWHISDRGIATYNSLPPGNYVLWVKGSNNSGVMNEEGDFIHLIVAPEWYQTIMFKVLCGLCLTAIIFYFVRRRIAAVRKELSFKQKIAETEMQALRAQMNPHFIFNSLNSIENFIMQNEKRLASDYLNKFAKLIRMILDSSRNELVPLAKDMEALQLYIDLEQLRFQNKFSYKTFIDPVLLNGDYRVPSLLVQPYVENAIVHGLAHSEEKELSLMLSATLEKDKIKYVVQDNGVGREKAAAYNRQNKPQHKSVGLKITEDRINMFNKESAGNGSVRFTDLYDGNGKPAGTKAEITINAI